MKLTLAQIQAFERIARLGSFHAAARALSLSQPSVSQRIRELEKLLGARLFIRRGPRISLTADGTALIAYADRLLGTTDEMLGQFCASEPLSGFLRIGVTEGFGITSLPDLLQRLNQRYPGLQAVVQVDDTGRISELLNENQLDVAITSEPAVADHIHREQLGVSPVGWFASVDADLPSGPLSPQDICTQRIVVTPPPTGLYTTTTRWLAQGGVVPQHLSMCNSLAVNILTIMSGQVIGVVPVLAMQDHVASGAVRQLTVTPHVPDSHIWICHRSGEAGPATAGLVELVRDLVSHYKLVA